MKPRRLFTGARGTRSTRAVFSGEGRLESRYSTDLCQLASAFDKVFVPFTNHALILPSLDSRSASMRPTHSILRRFVPGLVCSSAPLPNRIERIPRAVCTRTMDMLESEQITAFRGANCVKVLLDREKAEHQG
jgi:hypothetical protein